MKRTFFVLMLAVCPSVFAQITDYMGPGVATGGAGNIGRRSGQDVDLRYFVNATGVYDTGLTPFKTDGSGSLSKPIGAYGVELGLGAYGRHQSRRSVLGLDFAANYRHYPSSQSYNGLNQTLSLGYTFQKSQRLIFDAQSNVGSYTFGTAAANGGTVPIDSVVDQASLLFDNRTSYLQSGMDARYAKSSRTVFTAGGSAYTVRRQARALVGVNGYSLHGTVQHRLSQATTIGANYQHIHYDYPKAFGESDINMYAGTLSRVFQRVWIISLSGGVFRSEVQGIQNVAVDPALTALLGITSTAATFYRVNFSPTASGTLRRSFRKSALAFSYTRGVSPGNGVYLTSRQESADGGWSYTGVKKLSFSLNGSMAKLNALGTALAPYSSYSGSANTSYAITRSIQIGAAYVRRRQNIQGDLFQRDSSRVSFSIYYSPGEVPISFH
ncbi:MAG: hypothetical protein ABI995_13875 [Acidobacteriota bacterium]